MLDSHLCCAYDFSIYNYLYIILQKGRDFINDIIRKSQINSTENLVKELNTLNEAFNSKHQIRATNRILFFAGLMIALTNNNFRNTYKGYDRPSANDIATSRTIPLEAQNLNKAILEAISTELNGKINNHSKAISWRDMFAFIANVDFELDTYKKKIQDIEDKIYYPFSNGEKQDILGQAYKIFLSRAGKIEDKNIIFTPDHIKKLMVRLAKLSPTDTVLDTCMGSGGFLMEAMDVMINKAHNNPSTIKDIHDNRLIGIENDSVLFALACSNMFLHGDGTTNLIYRSSLIDNNNPEDIELYNEIRSKKPNRIIINPPYENNNPIKFTKQAIDYLEKDGKLIIIMPTDTLIQNQGKVSKNSEIATEGLTEKILKKAKLDYVIKMPDNLFSEQGRIVNTSIFGFTKTPHTEDDEVLFYNLKDDGFVSIQHKGRVDKNHTWNDIEYQIYTAISKCNEIQGVCVKRKIYENGVLHCEGVQNKQSLNKMYEHIPIVKLFKISNGTLASNNSIDGEFPFVTASKQWKSHISYDFNTEAIVYAVKSAGSLGNSHYIKGKFTASNLCLVLESKNLPQYPIDMQFYKYYFDANRNQIISDCVNGKSKKTINRKKFEEYLIPYIPYEQQIEFLKTAKVGEFIEIEQKYLNAKKQFEKDIDSLAYLF